MIPTWRTARLLSEYAILLPDGYNGDMTWFDSRPIAVDGELVKLWCCENGREHLIRWAQKSELE